MQTRTIIYPASLSGGYFVHAAAASERQSRAECSASLTSRTLQLREQGGTWLLGLLSLSTGCLLWQMNAEGLWLVRGISFSAALGGIFFWAVLLNSLWVEGRRYPAPPAAQEGFWFYSGGATHLEPVVGVLGQYAREVGAHAALLLMAEGGTWSFKAGYQCSAGLGRAVAYALQQCTRRDIQTACLIEVMDAAVVAFCTPLMTGGGREFLLVSLSESGEQACHGDVAAAALRYAMRIGCELNGVEPLHAQVCERKLLHQSAQAPVCCSICDRLQLPEHEHGHGAERWVPWNEWLFQRLGTPLTHGICPHCASWAYPELASLPVHSPFQPSPETCSAKARRDEAA